MHGPIIWHLGNITLNGKTLIMTWIVMAFLIIMSIIASRRLTSGTPGKLQNFLEWIVDFVKSLISDNMDYKKGAPLLSYLLTLIVFIFFSNILGLIPNVFAPLFHWIEFAQLNEILGDVLIASPTADINTTLALATLTVILVLVSGIRYKGIHYFHHFIEPIPVFLPIHLIDFGAKLMTLAFRLFGNIYAGEVLIAAMLMIPGFLVAGTLIPMPVWLGFSVFIGAIQSFVFTVLTIAYISQAVTSDS
ncbi:MAG: F0F1 ATP synthase subunit A [Peptococcaceae bacterium]|nr:F0F1 ATP synthase subunit A [Peptococcaceae bacterium]